MQAKVIGLETVSYTKKSTGEFVSGVSAHIIKKPPKTLDFVGLQCKEVWLTDVLLRNTVGQLEVGKVYSFEQEQNGNYLSIVDIIPLPEVDIN